MSVTPELVGMVVNFIMLMGIFVKLENRLTKLETTQDIIMRNFIDTDRERNRN